MGGGGGGDGMGGHTIVGLYHESKVIFVTGSEKRAFMEQFHDFSF